jgi:hypothetical protein
MIKAIKDNYQPGVSTNGKGNKFNNFPQNEYNFKELEDALLDN